MATYYHGGFQFDTAGNLLVTGAGGGGVALSAGTNSTSTGTVNFSNSNGVSFGMDTNGVVTASVAGTVAGGAVGLSAGTQSVNTGTVAFANSNNVTFGMSGSNQITASYEPFMRAVYDGANSVSSGTLRFSNSNGVSFGINGQTMTASVAAQTNQTEGMYAVGNTTGQSSSSTFDARTMSISGAGAVSVGYSGGAVVISAAAGGQSNQSIGIYGSSQTTGQSSSSTVDARSLSIVGAGAVSVGMSGGSFVVSAPNTVAFNPLSVGISTQGNTAGNTGLVSNQLLLVGSNNITLSGSTNAGSMTLSVIGGAGGGGVAISAGTQSVSTGTVAFANSNGVTFGMSGSSQITASVAAQTNQTAGLYAVGNTTGQSSSSTYDARSVSFSGAGAMSVGNSGGAYVLSAPATSSLSATGMASISTNGSTISIGVGTGVSTGTGTALGMTLTNNGVSLVQPTLTKLVYPDHMLTAISAFGNASASIQYMPVQAQVSASRVDALVQWSASSSATTNTMGIAMSVYAGIYTRNGSTLNTLSSGSTQTTYTYASNSAGQTQLQVNAIRPISCPVNINMGAGEYYVGFNIVTNTTSVGLSTTNLAQSVSMMGGANIQTAVNYAEFTAATATSTNAYGGMGVYSAATTGLPAAISLSAINQTGAALSQANIAVVLRNG